MPNWCGNTLYGRGKKEELERFKKKFQGPGVVWPDGIKYGYMSEEEYEQYKKEQEQPKFRFNALVPVPAEIIEKGFNEGGYEWCVENWGVKWDAKIELTEEYDDELIFEFDTAWAPPVILFVKASSDFPELTFCLYYCEPNVGVEGYFIIKNGRVVKEYDWGIHRMHRHGIEAAEIESEELSDDNS